MVLDVGKGIGTPAIDLNINGKYVIYPLEWWDSIKITNLEEEEKFMEELKIGVVKIISRFERSFKKLPKSILMSGEIAQNMKTICMKELSIPILYINGYKNQLDFKFNGLLNFLKNKTIL